ncbi:hypothetical protein [Jonesia quinghaiensis]|uniref:hypothetical protein n=1 Tax=Jonesia quinghaiensis TaxID=262806 RepID=UPI0004172B0F|nr:hypothetical protein [Jonesia quinghaiensis]
MANINDSLEQVLALDGAVAVAIVDFVSGMTLAHRSNQQFDLELAAAVNSEVVKSKLRAVEQLGLGEDVEDILITLTNHYHLIRISARPELRNLFFYVVIDRGRGNLGLARRVIEKVDAQIDGF